MIRAKQYKQAVELASYALKETPIINTHVRNFYINYIAKVIQKLWSETNSGFTSELVKSAHHSCTQTVVTTTLERLVSHTKPMLNDQIENHSSAVEKEALGRAFIDRALQLKNPMRIDESARQLVNLVSESNELPPFVMAEFSAVVDLAKTLAFGFLTVNREWFRFDKKGRPVAIEDRVVGRLFGECGFQTDATKFSEGMTADEFEAARERLLEFIQTYKEDDTFSNNESNNNNNFSNNNLYGLTRRHKPAGATGGRRKSRRSKVRQN
jgi:hypothetical protein